MNISIDYTFKHILTFAAFEKEIICFTASLIGNSSGMFFFIFALHTLASFP